MGDLGNIFSTINKDLGGGVSAQSLAKSGYQQYTPGAAPGLNMGAYGPNQAAQAGQTQIDQSANTFLPSQQGLVAQLQAQASGTGGPNMAAQQLQQGQQGNLAAALAQQASQRGNQNIGAAQKNVGENLAAINAGTAGQAAQIAAQQQLSGQQQLGGALGQFGNQQIGLAENQAGLNQQVGLANAGAQNNMAQFNTQSAQQGNAAQQAQYQYLQNMMAAQQSQENSAISGAPPANVAGAVIGAAGNIGGQALSNYMNTPSNNNGGGYNTSNGGVNLSDNPSASNAGAVPASPDSYAGGGASPLDLGGSAFGTGGPVSNPTITAVGEKGPEIAKLAPGSEIIPLNRPNTGQGLHPLDQHVQSLLAHPQFMAALKAMVGDQVMSKRMDALEAVLAKKKGK